MSIKKSLKLTNVLNGTRTFTEKDEPIYRSEIVDNLTSGGQTEPLSAEQGKELKTLSDNKLNKIEGIEDNFVSFDSFGAVQDSGKKATDFEPALPLTPEEPTTKVLNGNRQWSEMPPIDENGNVVYTADVKCVTLTIGATTINEVQLIALLDLLG